MKTLNRFLATSIALPLFFAACSAPPASTNSLETTNDDALQTLEADPTLNPVMEDIPIEDRDMGGHFITSLDTEPPLLNPILDAGDANTQYICGQIIETLLDLDYDTLEMIELLASSWEVSDDHLSYTFHLNPKATFSDGHPVTAEDVKFSWEIIIKPENDTASIRNYLQDIENVNIIDEHTIQFIMRKPYFRHLMSLGGISVFPKHLYGNAPMNTHPLNRAPVGSGPYLFEKWSTGQQIVLTRNENYWGANQPIEKRIWRIITDDNAALQALISGKTDYYRMKPDAWHRNASTPEFKEKFNRFTPDSPVPGYLGKYNYIGWNMRKPQFKDKEVRQALCMLFDRQLILDTVWGGLGRRITSGVYHRAPEYNDKIEPWPFDPEAAAKLLDQAGWIDTDQDGIRDKNGVKLEFELGYGSGAPEYDRLGTVYQEELKRAGINMILAPLEWASFIQQLQDRSFDACMLAWLMTPQPDPYQLWHSSQIDSGSNYPGFVNAESDEIIDKGRLEFDQAKRVILYHRQQEILHEEQPYLFLYSRPGLIAISNRFRGVINRTGGFTPMDWWIPKELQRYPATGSN